VLRSERHGLVRRELDRNRRRGISIRLTARGEQRLGKAVEQLGDERRSLIDLMSQLRG
jgi:DNA-binding MarR family transcriptional regulator